MRPQNPKYATKIKELFEAAPFMQSLGVHLKDCGPGWCETALKVEPRHYQQDEVLHAGVLASMADHTAGGAAATLIEEHEIVLTLEFKINLLRPADEEVLYCKAKVLKAGQRITVAESEVYGLRGYQKVHYAKAMVTLAILTERN